MTSQLNKEQKKKFDEIQGWVKFTSPVGVVVSHKDVLNYMIQQSHKHIVRQKEYVKNGSGSGSGSLR